MAGFGGTIKLGGSTEYKEALKQITQNLTLVSSEMKKVTAEYGKNDNSTEALTASNEILTKRLVEQKNKVELLKKQLDEAAKEYGENSDATKKWQVQLNNAEAEVIKTTKQIDKNTQAIDANEKATEQNTDALEDYSDEAKNAGDSSIKLGDLIKSHVIGGAILDGFKALAGAVADVAREFFNFVKSGVENASNLAEVQNVVDVVFGESAVAVEDFSKKAATAFGMSELSVKKYAGSMGAMLDSMGLADTEVTDMSLSLVGLAGDMASFYNLDHDEAWDKIRAGISGETEPLKQLGINMSVANLEAYALSQGIDTAYNSMTQAEQATLRYNYLMEVTANAQGDFARTSDGFANQQRILSLQIENLATNMGTFLLPTLNEGITAFNDMLSGELSLEEGIGRLTQIVVDLANTIVASLPELTNAGIVMLDTIINGFLSALPNLLPAVTILITSLLQFIVQSLPAIIDAGVQIVLALVQGIGQSLPELVPAVIDAVLTIVDNLIDNIDLIIDAGIQLIIGLADGLIKAIPQLVGRIPEIIEKLLAAIYRNEGKLIKAGIDLTIKLGAGLIQAIPQLVGMIPQIITGIVNGLKSGLGSIKNVGVDLLKGLWDGISSWASTLWGKIKDLGKNIVNKFKSALGIHSPSKVMADEVGTNMALGLGVGFENTMKDVNAQMSDAINTDYTLDASVNAAGYGGLSFDTLVDAFKTALKGVQVVMDSDEMGEFVEKTVTRVVYA